MSNTTLTISLLKLFNGVLISENKAPSVRGESLKYMVSRGFIMDSRIPFSQDVVSEVEQIFGIDGLKVNSTLHKSWEKIRSSGLETLYAEQIVHYILSYGISDILVRDDSVLWIPAERLNVPEIEADAPLMYIKGLTRYEIFEQVILMGTSGIALSKDTIDELMNVISLLDYDSSIVGEMVASENINRELMTALCMRFDIAPREPVAWLRYVVTKLTGETLLIKNRNLIELIKSSDGKVLDAMLMHAPYNLSSIFFRFKPVFLAMKSVSKYKGFFNRLRRDAEQTHAPVVGDYLSRLTSVIASGDFRSTTFSKALEGKSFWRKARLLGALTYRMNATDSIVYKIRNGKTWTNTAFEWGSELKRHTVNAISVLLDSMAEDIAKSVEGKKVFIPAGLYYGIPATEKMFVGRLPSNTFISVEEKNVLVGVHWYNSLDSRVGNNGRIDIDFSASDIHGKFGWDGAYRGGEILFSGDVVNAPRPNGAAEFFTLSNRKFPAKILKVNHFTHRYNDEASVDFTFMVARGDSFYKNYMVDPNKILVKVPMTIPGGSPQLAFGLLIGLQNETRVYFVGGAGADKFITSRNNRFTASQIDFFVESALSSVSLNDLIERAGGIIVHEEPVDEEYLNLSPDVVDKTTFISLIG